MTTARWVGVTMMLLATASPITQARESAPPFPLPAMDENTLASLPEHGLPGYKLRQILHHLVKDDHKKRLSYKEVWKALMITDFDPRNKKNVILFYG